MYSICQLRCFHYSEAERRIHDSKYQFTRISSDSKPFSAAAAPCVAFHTIGSRTLIFMTIGAV